MRELDTESPVVWPAWCYTGEVSTSERRSAGRNSVESAELAASASGSGGGNVILAASTATTSASAALALDARGGASPQEAAITHLQAGAVAPRQPRPNRRRQINHNGIDATQVKTERLTPDNNSTSSRSVTPSSSGHPSTPPNAASQSGPEGPAVGPTAHHLKHMEQMMGRNYSDFMRSLAAKYNNSNPNECNFGTSRNGYAAGLEPRFSSFVKATAAPTFVGLMGPLGAAGTQAPQVATGASIGSSTPPDAKDQPKELKQTTESTAATIFGPSSPANLFPPMLDMSSTQALLHMVRTANAAQSAAELESYLKGANKREPSLTSPLDLSSPSGTTPRKRARTTTRAGSISPKPNKQAPGLGLTVTPIPSPTGPMTPLTPMTSAHAPTVPTAPCHSATMAMTAMTAATATPRAGSPPPVRCPSLCGHMPCGDGQSVNRWTIEDVVAYISSIDICAEYAQNFREHRIDGASLPLLSEEHLIGPIGMKLGPALKLRVLLARKLGACTVCLHCAHCHQTALPTALTAAAAVAAAAQAAAAQQVQHVQHAPQSQQSTTGRRNTAN